MSAATGRPPPEAEPTPATPPVLTSPRMLLATATLLLPMAGLALLLAQPRLDVMWEHHPSHFWLVLAAGSINAVLAYATGTAARRRADARVFLVSLAFLSAAGFLGLHALATPGVLLADTNAGFALATPAGLLLASVFAAASSAELSGTRAATLMRHSAAVQWGVLAVMAVWAALSLASVPPLDDPAAPERASGGLVVLAAAGVTLYAVAVARYLWLYTRRAAPLLVAMAASFALLAEAEASVAFGRNWHATWWEWHLLMLTAFVLVAVSAHRQWHEERFSGLYLPQTSGGTREVSVLFADLAGFTRYSEQHDPRHVTAMLNEYFERAVPPLVERHGGRVDRLIGDALMATFNTRADQPDHAVRAARAALAIQAETAAIAARHPDWPRFRVGVNTGEAVVGVLGARGGRTYTTIGDAVNLAARLESQAPVGGVAIGGETARRLTGARLEPLGPISVKGKEEPVEAFRLLAVDG